MEKSESKAMTELREIKKKMAEEMMGMTTEEKLQYIKEKSMRVEKEFNLNLPRLEKTTLFF